METFDRIGPSPFYPDGTTLDTDICFGGGSKLKIYGGSPYSKFRLRYSNRDGEGWWVVPESLDQLIAELLYIRRDMQGFKDGIDLDIEVGRVSAGEPPVGFRHSRMEIEEVEHEEESDEQDYAEDNAPF